MSIQENKTLVRRLLEEGYAGDLSLIDECVANDFVDHSGWENREGLKQAITMLQTAFPEMQLTVEDMVAEGDKVAVRPKMTGTHKGEFMGISPTAKRVTRTATVIFRIADGKVVEHWGHGDPLDKLVG